MKASAQIRAGGLLLLAPLALALQLTDAVPPVWIFLVGLAAIAALADWVRRSAEQVAEHAGAGVGSLLNVSFGNAAELNLALFVLAKAQTPIVRRKSPVRSSAQRYCFWACPALISGLKQERHKFAQARSGCFRPFCCWSPSRFFWLPSSTLPSASRRPVRSSTCPTSS